MHLTIIAWLTVILSQS